MKRSATFGIGGGLSILLLLFAAACSPEKRDWKEAQRSDSEFRYGEYLGKYPQGVHAAEAKARIEGLAFQQALGQDTIEALKEFQKAHPAGANAAKAADRIDDLTWKQASLIASVLDCETYLAAYPQGRHAAEARARVKDVLDARPPEWRDVRTVKFVLRQTFGEDVKDVELGFEPQFAQYFQFIGLRSVDAAAPADATLTVTGHGEPMGESYAAFAFAYSGTFYYTGAHVYGRIVLERPGVKPLREDFDGTKPVPHSFASGAYGTEASGAPFAAAMEKDFPRKASRLLARAFGYRPMAAALGSRDAVTASGAVQTLRSGGAPALGLLLKAVESPDSLVRENAAEALAGHRDARSIAALITLLGSEGGGEDVSLVAAADSLSIIGSTAVPALEEAAKDPKAVMREGAAMALGGIRTPPSLAALLALLGDAEPRVRDAAIRSVGEHKRRDGVAALIEGLGNAKPADRDAWLKAIEASTEEPAETDEEEVGIVPAPALDWDRDLIARLAARVPALLGEADMKDRLAGAFERFGAKAQSVVAAMLKAETPVVRAWAADVVGRSAFEAGFRILLPLVGDADAGVRLQVVRALGRFDAMTARLEPLAKLLQDPSPDVAKEALLTLRPGEWDDEAKAALRRALGTPERVKLLIGELAGGNGSEGTQAASEILGALGRPVVARLAEALKDGRPAVRQAVVETLGRIGDPQAGPALADLAKNEAVGMSEDLMTAVYKALADTKSPQAFDILVAGLKDAAWTRQKAAIDGLGALGNVRAADALVALLPSDKGGLADAVGSTMRELTKYEPEDTETTFDWKAWWAKNRARYGLK